MHASKKRMLKTVAAVGAEFPALGNAANVERIVRFVLATWRKTQPRVDPEPYDDARDIQNWSAGLVPLSPQDIRLIANGRRSEVKEWARKGQAPFNKMREPYRGLFAKRLSGRVIIKIAQFRRRALGISAV